MSTALVDPAATRADVVRARSRMRTKHGGRAAIGWLNDHLETEDVLTHLARSRALDGHTHDGAGVVGLTEHHLLYVPDTLHRADLLRVPLDGVVAVGWTRGRREGDLSVATRRSAWEFRQLAAGDLRELVEALADRVPDAVGRATLSPAVPALSPVR